MGKMIDNYSLQQVIGQGVYAKVHKAINVKTRQEVAIKVVQVKKFQEIPKLEECTLNQINILASINRECQYIVKYIDMLQSPNNYYFVYEFCNGGTLEKMMQKQGPLPQKKVLSLLKQIFQAFKVLSKHNIMHRDLKPDNILLHNGNIKLADFGFCKPLESKTDLAQTMLGSPLYMAPEVLKGQIYTMKADIWSMGVVLYQMIYGRCPFESKTIAQLIQQVEMKDLYIPSNPIISKITEELMRRMLTKDPLKRISWQQIFNRYTINDAGQLAYKSQKIQLRSSIKSPSTFSVQLKSGLGEALSMKINNQHHTQRINKSYQNTNFDDSIAHHKKSPYKSINGSNLIKTQSNSAITVQSISFHSKTDRSGRLQILLKNHSKTIQISQMILDVNNLQQMYAIYISCLLLRTVEKEIIHLNETLKKEVANEKNIYKSDNYEYFKEFKTMVEQQYEKLQTMNIEFRNQLVEEQKWFSLLDGRIQEIDKHKHKILKLYIENLKHTDEDLRLASQIIDYLEESLLIKRDAYQRMSRDHLHRQLRNKLSKF